MFQSFVVKCPDIASTENLAKKVAQFAEPRDVFLLDGTLGVGKSVFARAFIQSLTDAKEVPSPTFTLVQTYQAANFDIFHFDLYRLKSPEEIWELNIEEAFSYAVSLIEWPEKMGPYVPREAIKISITTDENGCRIFEFNFPTEVSASKFGKNILSNQENIYATTVDIEGNGILIIGSSGKGKSDLALRLIQNKNAVLVSDDRTDVKNENGHLIASPPQTIEGLLEVRGIGIMKMAFKSQTEIKLAVISALKEDIERHPSGSFFEVNNVTIPSILLDFLEPSAPDKIVVKLKSILEDGNQKT